MVMHTFGGVAMTIDEAIKICNTMIFAASLSNPQGTPLSMTKEELTEAMGMAIKALEEVQQYRQIGKISTCKNAVEICKAMIERGIDPDNIAEYIKFEDNLMQRGYDLKRLLEMMEKHKQYCQIGTVEECREAVEKQTAKKPTLIDYKKYTNFVDNADFLQDAYWCPNCKRVVRSGSFCRDCGQHIDWSDEE